MAIDPRISLAGVVPSNAPALTLFNNALTSATDRGIAQEKAARQAELQPFLVQQHQQVAAQNQLNSELANEDRVIRSLSEFGTQLKPVLQSNDPNKALLMLEARFNDLTAKGLPTDTTLETIQAIQNGDSQGVIQGIDSVQEIAMQRGLIGGQQPQRARVTSSKILDDGTTVQSLSTGGTNVISPSGEVLEGASRVDALNKALSVKVQQKGDIAQAVSDVKIGETVALETESEETAQKIQKQRINIDETKFKNEQKRDQVINAKNSRRKEADSAILQVNSLLTGDRFTSAFGKGTAITPELLRSQDTIDAIADVNQIKGLITLESRQKLKGQGTITDSEQKILAQSATVLDNPLISDDRARRELRKIRIVFEDASDRNQLKRETKDRIEQETKQQAVDEDAQSGEFAGFKVIR